MSSLDSTKLPRLPRWLSNLSSQQPGLVRLLILALTGLLTLTLWLIFHGPLSALEERVGARGWTLVPDRQVEERVAIIAIDEKSLATVGPWPWSRDQMARLVDALTAAGAQLQLHDIVYAESRPGDEALFGALRRAEGAVLAQLPMLQPGAFSTNTGVLSGPVASTVCDSANAATQFPGTFGFVAPAAEFSTLPKGHISAVIDPDGAVRRTPALICHEGNAYPALAVSAFLAIGSSPDWRVSIEPGTGLLSPAANMTLRGYPGLNIPLDGQGNLRIPYNRAPDSFIALSAVDVMNGNFEPSLLDNTWVLIGGTAFGMADIVPTPYSGAAHGVELQARLLTGLLDVNLPYTPLGAPLLLALLALGFATSVSVLADRGDRLAAYGLPLACVLFPIVALLLHWVVLATTNLWLGWVAPALFGLLASGALLLFELYRVRSERERVFGNLSSYLPLDVARDIAFSLPSSSIRAESRDATLLSADLRNFSAFGEARSPEESAAVLHFFFTRATAIVEQHGGRVHEFKGDGLLAIWDGCDGEVAEAALASARELQFALTDSLLPKETMAGLEPLALGIGIEQGPVLVGSIGPAHRRSHVLLGDTVSIVLRIQEMTADLAQPVLLGETISRQLVGSGIQSQGSYLLSGLTIPHTLFAPLDNNYEHRNNGNQDGPGPRRKRPRLSVVSGGRP